MAETVTAPRVQFVSPEDWERMPWHARQEHVRALAQAQRLLSRSVADLLDEQRAFFCRPLGVETDTALAAEVALRRQHTESGTSDAQRAERRRILLEATKPRPYRDRRRGRASRASRAAFAAAQEPFATVDEAWAFLVAVSGRDEPAPLIAASAEQAGALIRRARRSAHPDAGGNPRAWARVQAAAALVTQAFT